MTKASNMSSTQNKAQRLAFAAIDPYIASNIVEPTESEQRGRDYISWGDGNRYPEYLENLGGNCATLQTIINGTADYVVGNGVVCNVAEFARQVNKNGDTMHDIVYKIAVNYLTFGGYALSVVRNNSGNIGEIDSVYIPYLRSDKDNKVFYYSEEWRKSRVRAIRYPKYLRGDNNATSILYVKSPKSRGTYPVPIWNAAVRAAELDTLITNYHLNSIQNGFAGGHIFNFNDGEPDDEQKVEIERNINEKFAGSENAGRILISYNSDKEHALDIQRIDVVDLDKKYEAVATWSMKQLYTAFRAIPCLFGLPTENSGFNREEFLQAFELYNKTVVNPIQQLICREMDKLFDVKDSISIIPFSLENTSNNSDE